ncbi:MAG: carbohydrate binding domain-containing protein [Terriglobales bacterium]
MPPREPALFHKILFVLICVALVAMYGDRVLRVYLAHRAAESPAIIPGLQRATRLAPGNATFPHLLGLQLSVAGQDRDGALLNLRRAVALNPYNGRYWLDLAAAYQEADNLQLENQALQSAIAAEPGNPEVAAEAAQYYLAVGDAAHALPLVRQALSQDPQVAPSLLLTCWRATHDADLLLANALSPNPELQFALLRVLGEQNQPAAASRVWRQIVASRRPFSPKISVFYLDYLLKEHDVTGFDRAWHDLASIAPGIQPYLPTTNLIVNPGFEQPILNYGFDWRHQPADHIVAASDDTIGHSGTRSLSLSYDGSPAYDAGWTQFVPVRSGAAYNFSAWITSENVTSSSGPRIAVADAFSGANLLVTDDVLDTHPWHEVTGQLQVPAATSLVVIKFIRGPANTKIRGRVWIDDLRLEAR